MNFRSSAEWEASVHSQCAQYALENELNLSNPDHLTKIYEAAKAAIVKREIIDEDGVKHSKPLFKKELHTNDKELIQVWYDKLIAEKNEEHNHKMLINIQMNYKPQLDIGEAFWRQLYFITADEANMHNAAAYLANFYNNIAGKGQKRALTLAAQEIGQQGKTTLMIAQKKFFSELGITWANTDLPQVDGYVDTQFALNKVAFVNDTKFRRLDYELINNIIDNEAYTPKIKYVRTQPMQSTCTLVIASNYLPKDLNSARYNIIDVYTGYGSEALKEVYSGWKNIPDNAEAMNDWLKPAIKDLLWYALNDKLPVKFITEKTSRRAESRDLDEFINWYLDAEKELTKNNEFCPADVAKAMLPNASRQEVALWRHDLTKLFRSFPDYKITKRGHSIEYHTYKLEMGKVLTDCSESGYKDNKEVVWEFFHNSEWFKKWLHITTLDEKRLQPNLLQHNEIGGSVTTVTGISGKSMEINKDNIKKVSDESGYSGYNTSATSLGVTSSYDVRAEKARQLSLDVNDVYIGGDARGKFDICAYQADVPADSELMLMTLNDMKSCEPTQDHKMPYSDDNVYMDNFMFECDHISKEEQWKLIGDTTDKLGAKVKSVIFSGNKSYHTIIHTNFEELTKDDDYETKKALYKKVWQELNKMYFKGHADSARSNPAGWTRAPNVLRKENPEDEGVPQTTEFWAGPHLETLNISELMKWQKYLLKVERVKSESLAARSKRLREMGIQTTEEQTLANYAKANPMKWADTQKLLNGEDLGSGANYIGIIGRLEKAGLTELAAQARSIAHNLHPSNIPSSK